MINFYNSKVQVISKTAKGQVFFRKLLKRQKTIMNSFVVTSKFPRAL